MTDKCVTPGAQYVCPRCDSLRVTNESEFSYCEVCGWNSYDPVEDNDGEGLIHE